MLARSLHPKCYEHNPRFLRYIEESGLSLRPHLEFNRQDLDQRQELYSKIAAEIWDPARIDCEVNA
jgi:hypothetical protein